MLTTSTVIPSIGDTVWVIERTKTLTGTEILQPCPHKDHHVRNTKCHWCNDSGTVPVKQADTFKASTLPEIGTVTKVHMSSYRTVKGTPAQRVFLTVAFPGNLTKVVPVECVFGTKKEAMEECRKYNRITTAEESVNDLPKTEVL